MQQNLYTMCIWFRSWFDICIMNTQEFLAVNDEFFTFLNEPSKDNLEVKPKENIQFF